MPDASAAPPAEPPAASPLPVAVLPVAVLPVAATLLALAGVRSGDTVADVGCGAGLLTYAAAAGAGDGGLVYGVDASATLLAAARARRPSRICWVRADAARLPFADSSVDRVLAGPRAWSAGEVGEWARVLTTRVATCAWGPFRDSAAESAVEAALRDVVGSPVAAPGDGGAPLRELVERAGLRVAHESTEDVVVPFASAAAYAAWRLSFPAPAAALAAGGEAARAAVVARVVAALGDGPVHSESVVHSLAATPR